MFRRFPLHPLLLAVVPVLALYRTNAWEVPPVDLIRPMLAALLISVAGMAVAGAVVRRRRPGAILALILIAAIYAYPFLFDALYALWPPEEAGRHGLALSIWGGAVAWAVAGGIRLARRPGTDFERATAGLNVFALALALLVAGQAAFQWRRTSARPPVRDASLPAPAEPVAAESRDPWLEQALASIRPADSRRYPDIYYVILDGYAREDILESRFNFRNRELRDWLRGKGFFIAEKSHCNYSWTHLCLAAIFNLEYLQDLLPAGYGDAAPEEYRERYKYFVAQMGADYVRQSRVRRLLEALGYRVITVDTGSAVTRQIASEKIRFAEPLTSFEQALIRKTVFWPLVEILETRATRREGVAGAAAPAVNRNVRLLRELPVVAEAAGPKFVFYHVMAPHPPLCFDENGNVVRPHPVFEATSWLVDCQRIPGYREFYRARYPLNVAGLNVRLEAALDDLWRKTEGQAVVILQSDHGSQLGMDPFDAAKTDVPERFGILNAIYVPARYECPGLAEDLSAVNTFRVVFRAVFGLDLPRLEDRAWFSLGDLNFTEVTDRLR